MMAVKKLKSMNMNHNSLVLFLFLFFSMTEVCIAALNVNGATNSKKRAELFEVLDRKNRCYFHSRDTQ